MVALTASAFALSALAMEAPPTSAPPAGKMPPRGDLARDTAPPASSDGVPRWEEIPGAQLDIPFMHISLGGPGGEGGVADCPQVIQTYSSANFSGGSFIVEAGMAEGEVAAAQYTVPADQWPIRIDLTEIIWATSNASVQTTTMWSVLFWQGAPGNGASENPPAYFFSSDGVVLPNIVLGPGTAGVNVQFMIDPGDPDQIYLNDDGSHTFTVGYRIDHHNQQTANPCFTAPPTCCNAFPTVDTNGLAQSTKNWIKAVNCGQFGCPAGWHTFSGFSPCTPSGDWNLRVTYTGLGCAPPPVGACCAPAGTCSIQTQADCAAAGGTWQGANSNCGQVTCTPTGMVPCCFVSTGGCVNLSYANCVGAGGVPGPVGQTCTGYTCFPTGACCKPDGTCSVMSPGDCAAANGVYQGNGTTCGQVNCPPPMGAACFGNGFCLMLTQQDAINAGATWHGPGTTCADNNGNGVADICEAIPGDINGDGKVNGSDLGLLLGAWGTNNTAADLNHDGTVNGADLGILIGHWTG